MAEHSRNAIQVAQFLEKHAKVQRVVYPGRSLAGCAAVATSGDGARAGLPSHPQHELAKRQMSGFGGMITFFLKGGLGESRTFLETLKVRLRWVSAAPTAAASSWGAQIFKCAESLGAVESLAEHP